MKHFVNVKSYEELKTQFKKLAMQHHPDRGGKTEIMQEVNAEYDILFPIWKRKNNVENKETASSTRSEFYTQNGWKGTRYNSSLSTKDIAERIRTYAKEAYPTYKFSVTCEFFSGGSAIHVSLMEAPHDVFKQDKAPINGYVQSAEHYFSRKVWNGDKDTLYELTDSAIAVLKDVKAFMDSYNRKDCDGMIDYFNVNFWDHFNIGKWDKPFKVVEKIARVKATTADKTEVSKNEDKEKTFNIIPDIDTRDGSAIFVVKILDKLDRDEYINTAEQMKKIGGYYSKFKHGFLFKNDPTEVINTI